MLWNTVLALIPVVLTLLLLKRSEQRRGARPVLFWCSVALIMLFLPNAPYVATDLVHFLETVRTTDISPWRILATQFPLYVAFVLLGLVSYAFTADRILFGLRQRYGKTVYRTAFVVIPLLNAIGIYLGRVARFNSWDILQDPITIARSSRNVLLDARMMRVIFVMTILLLVVHEFYHILHDGIRVRMKRYRSIRST